MPRYDYTCPDNGLTIEVTHGMSEHVETWGALCAKAGIQVRETPPETPVVKELSTGTRVERASRTHDVSLPRSCACGHTHGCAGH